MPCEWNPSEVINPENDMPFTEAGAWEYVACLAEKGQHFTEVELRKPKGDIAFETEIVPRENLPRLYIKVQLKCGKVWGRSFHNSTQ
jgi:hypothetical protein